jgi:hypothetical protein
MNHEVRTTELGDERRCTCCGEFCPADREFFNTRADNGRMQSWCRACCADAGAKRRAAAVAARHAAAGQAAERATAQRERSCA